MIGAAELIENKLSGEKKDDILLKFQRKLLEELSETEKRMKYAGLDNEKVILDLFESQHPDMPGEYKLFRTLEQRKHSEKRMHKFLFIGTPIYFLLMIATYLGISFMTQNWTQSWLIIIAFVTVWVDSVAVILSKEISLKRRLFHPIARVLTALGVMMTTSFIYLIGLILFAIPHFWVVFPAGVSVMFLTDGIFAYFTDQKLRIINYLIYVPATMPMIYVILGGLHIIPWHPGWLIVILGVVIDAIIAICKIIDNRKYIYRPEE